HSGEGNYEETEAAIQFALAERARRFKEEAKLPSLSESVPAGDIAIDFGEVKSPETYFGAERNEYLGNGKQFKEGVQMLSTPEKVFQNTLYLTGTWDFKPEFAKNTSQSAKIQFYYSAKNVYFVAAAEK